jgi:hypothetical protein
MSCSNSTAAETIYFSIFFTVKADTPVSSGAGSLKDWYLTIGAVAGSYSVGTGAFVEPDYLQSYTVTSSTLPPYISFTSGTNIFNVIGAVSNTGLFSSYHMTITLTATGSSITA